MRDGERAQCKDLHRFWHCVGVFSTASAFVYVLAFFSIPRVRRALPDRFWPPIRALAMHYIALAFLWEFTKFRVRPSATSPGD